MSIKNAEQLQSIFFDALEELGGTDFLVENAKADPKTFITVISRLLPKTQAIEVKKELPPVKSLRELYNIWTIKDVE